MQKSEVGPEELPRDSTVSFHFLNTSIVKKIVFQKSYKLKLKPVYGIDQSFLEIRKVNDHTCC